MTGDEKGKYRNDSNDKSSSADGTVRRCYRITFMTLKFSKITAKAVQALPVHGRATEHGIVVERLSNFDLRYSVNIMVDGVRIHRVVGRASEGVTRTQCETFIEQKRTEAREGRLALPKGRKTEQTFASAGASYIAKLRETDGKGVDRKERQFSLHLNPFFGTLPLAKISTFDIARYRKQRASAGASKGTVNRELAVVSHLFSKAVEWGWTQNRPKIERFKEDAARIVYLTPEQCQRVIDAAVRDQSPHIYPFTVIALSTSMRMSEILTMRREHVDPDRRRIYIPKAKAGARDQPVTAELAKFLAEHMDRLPQASPWLFPSSVGKSGHLATIRKAHRRVVAAAGLDPDVIVRHTFRHTAITHLVQAGVDLPTVQKISGHKTLSMVARYSHANGAHIDSAMDKLEGRINLSLSIGSESGEIAA
jgi:integrase